MPRDLLLHRGIKGREKITSDFPLDQGNVKRQILSRRAQSMKFDNRLKLSLKSLIG